PTFHGHIAVGSGLSYEVALSWTPTTYPIQFTEQGLPNGTVWTVTVNGTAHTSNLSGITVPEVNGSYPYSFGPVAGFISPSGGTLRIQGQARTVTAVFDPFNFTLTLIETGLPSGSSWWFNISGGPSQFSDRTGLQFGVPNGTYQYTATSVTPGYHPLNGSFTVRGSNLTLSLSFTAVRYTVEFVAVGLAPGASWSVDLNGTTSTTHGTTLTFSET
ncbi:thermopsin precursor, partial [mine drainage metagenome]